MTRIRIEGNSSFNIVPDKDGKQLPDDTILYDNLGYLGTIKGLRDKHFGKDTTKKYRELYYDDNAGGGRKRRRTKKSKRSKRRKTNRRRR